MNNMSKIEKEHHFENQIVKYVFSPAKQDRKHLLVIFSGFGLDYDFFGATAEGCRSNILWIKDEFQDENTYYLCVNNDFSVEYAVIDLINTTLGELSINEQQCTLVGFSKGGSAALYYALKYNFSNILTSCPQIKIGSYLKSNWPSKVEHILGKNITNEKVSFFDELIPKLLNEKDISGKNIYLVTSTRDEQYSEQVEPFLSYFIKCNNFNLINTNSSLAWQHNKITKYNIPIILSILYAHGEGVFPRFGYISNGIPASIKEENKIALNNLKNKKNAIAIINKIRIDSNIIYPDGVALIKGYECSSFEKIKHKLVFIDGEYIKDYPLGKIINNDLSYQFFEKTFCNYSAGQITSIAQKGIDISLLPQGTYAVKCLIEVDNISILEDFAYTSSANIQSTYGEKIISAYSRNGKLYVGIKDLRQFSPGDNFEIKNKWLRNAKLHYEGIYAVKGIEINNWGDATYYILLSSEHYLTTRKIGLSHQDFLNTHFSDHYGLYNKSYFCTIGNNGVDISDIPNGVYNIKIILSKSGMIFEKDTGDYIEKNNNDFILKSH